MSLSSVKRSLSRQKFLLNVLLQKKIRDQRQKLLKSSAAFKALSRKMTKTFTLPLHQGVLVGRREALPVSGEYYVFQGIPYAEPPVGPLRFEPAVPKEIRGHIDCTQEGGISLQPDMLTKVPVGGEDCLYLNVYSPDVSSGKKLPVMLFVHGGAFALESGGTDWRSPEYLVQEGVVVVTINYRLNFLGFLHLPEGGIHGNQGLKDQRVAMRWVRDNIGAFGGDPNNVTAFGHSAGACSVHTHALLPGSQPLFQKAILMSGIATMDWFIQNRPEEKARKLAKLCGCQATTDREIAEFLRKSPTLPLLANFMSTLSTTEKRRGLPIIFKPVIESPGPQAIITQSIVEKLKTPNLLDIPVIMGVTNKDGMVMVLGQQKRLEAWDREPGRFIPRTVDVDGDDDEACRPLGDKIKKHYLGENSVTHRPYEGFLDFMTDYNFTIAMHSAAEMHSRFQHSSTPLFYYQFSFDGELNMMKKLLDLERYPGANHGDDMTYLFVMKMAEIKVDESSEAATMRRKMCRMWANFAKFGDPTPGADESKWVPVRKHRSGEPDFDLDVFDINSECRMIKSPEAERMKFWRQVFQDHNGGFLKPKL